MKTRLTVASVLCCAGIAAAQPQATVIYTKIPGHPTSAIIGARDLDQNPVAAEFKALEDFAVNPRNSGQWVLKGRTNLGADLETCLVYASGGPGTIMAQEGQFAPGSDPSHRFDFFASAMGTFDTAGDYAFAFRARSSRTGSTGVPDGQRVATWDGSNIAVQFKQGDLITGLQDQAPNPVGDELVGNSVGSIHLLDDGRIGSQDTTITNIHSSRRPALMYNLNAFQQVTYSPITTLDGEESTWTFFASNGFYTTPDGAHWMAQGRRTGQASTATLLALNNQVVLETGQPIPGTDVIVDGIFQWVLLHDGSWYARGDQPNDDDWFVANGVLVAKTGDPITTGSTELWGAVFSAFGANTNGDWILVGNTNNADPGLDTVAVLNGEEVLLRESDPLDLDGNGQFDDDVFIGRANPANVPFEANDTYLTDDGTVYMLVSIRDGDGIEYNTVPAFGTPQCLITFNIYGGEECPPCAADYNNDGGVDGADVESFFLAWEDAQTCADVNEDGGIDGADVEFFFVAWENGGC
jgi:hypothetical protein